MKKLSTVVSIASLVFLTSCVEEEEITTDPVSELNALVKEYGYIGFQNAMDRADSGTHTGTLVGGRPTALSYISNPETCFPVSDELPRYTDNASVNKKYSYSYQGNFGILSLGIPIVSAGLDFSESMTIDIEINGLSVEYLDSIDVTDWYRDGMRETCREYLEDVGFLIQTIHTDSMKLSIKRIGGTSVGLTSDNIGNYFQFEAGVNWNIVDEYTIEITTPHTLGYQIGFMESEDNGKALYRAMSVEDDQFIFEKIGFSDLDFLKTVDDLGIEGLDQKMMIIQE